MMSYIILSRCWYDIFVLNIHATTGNKIDDVKNFYYEKLESIFDRFSKCDVKTLFQCQSRQGRLFKPTIEKESLHEINNDNRVWLQEVRV
jgi:hypothetical protein